MDHAEHHEDHPHIISRNARYGLIFFAVYVLLYGGFIYLAVFEPKALAASIGGVNIAILYGFGLILAAFIMALIYTWLCRRRTPRD